MTAYWRRPLEKRCSPDTDEAGRASWSGATSSAATPDRDHSGRGDQQSEDSLDRGHHAASAPVHHRHDHATPSAHRPVPARPTRESIARLNKHRYRNRQKQAQKRHTRRSSSSGDRPDQEDRGPRPLAPMSSGVRGCPRALLHCADQGCAEGATSVWIRSLRPARRTRPLPAVSLARPQPARSVRVERSG
jgi:hypothetical protein